MTDYKDIIKNLFTSLPEKVKIGKRYVGQNEDVFVIAEAGINHNGDIQIAKELINVAASAGADAIKFQKRTIDDILTKDGLDKPYDSPHAFAPTYGEHRKKLEFTKEQYRELMEYAKTKNILIFASVWDKNSADDMEDLGIDAYKIPSADLINLPLLEYVAKKDKPILLSTGMSTEQEIDLAVKTVLRYTKKVIIFHCVSLYPCPDDKVNLNFMDALIAKFSPLPIGYSGHEIDLFPTFVAVSRGATIIERHLTLDKSMKGGDHAASLNPSEFKELIEGIRRVKTILGDKEKMFYKELVPIREKLAKSVVTKKVIKKGEVITFEMLTIKGPGNGINPSDLEKLVGSLCQIDLDEDVVIPKDALLWPKK